MTMAPYHEHTCIRFTRPERKLRLGVQQWCMYKGYMYVNHLCLSDCYHASNYVHVPQSRVESKLLMAMSTYASSGFTEKGLFTYSGDIC